MLKFSIFHYLSLLLIALLYLLLATLIPNWRMFIYFIQKFNPRDSILFIWYTLQTTWTSQSPLDFFLTIISSLLVGANTVLIITTIKNLGKNKKVTFSVGGASLISFIATGCASCSLSLFSVFGLTGAISFLPFHGLEVHLLSIILLAVSLLYMLNQLQKTKYCKVKK